MNATAIATATFLDLNTKTNRREARVSKAIREAAGETGTNIPIETIDGFDAPEIVGRSYHWTTRTGRPVYHPSAYARKGWSSLVYHGSTRAIVVGRGWIIQHTDI